MGPAYLSGPLHVGASSQVRPHSARRPFPEMGAGGDPRPPAGRAPRRVRRACKGVTQPLDGHPARHSGPPLGPDHPTSQSAGALRVTIHPTFVYFAGELTVRPPCSARPPDTDLDRRAALPLRPAQRQLLRRGGCS